MLDLTVVPRSTETPLHACYFLITVLKMGKPKPQTLAPQVGGRLHQKNHEGTKRNIETCNRDYEPRLRTILSGLQGPSDRLNTFANSSSPFAQNGLHGAKPPPPTHPRPSLHGGALVGFISRPC